MEIDFCTLKIHFVELDFYNLIFQNSSTDQQGVSYLVSKFFGDNKMAVNRLLLFYVQLFRFRKRAVGKSEYLKGKVSSNPRPFEE